MTEQHYLVPLQNEGFEKDITHSVVAKTIEDAEDWFVDAKERLLDVNNWEKYSPSLSVEFRLADSHGKGVKRGARRHDHIRIDIPGYSNGHGNPGGFDWATIEAMEYDDYPDDSMETFALRIRPSEHPQYQNDDVSNLFPGNDVSCTFVITRQGKNLLAAYHGRNELVHSYTVISDAVNESELISGGWLGLSDIQWTDLMKGLLK